MKRLYLPLILLVFLVLESTAIDFLPNDWVMSNYHIIPHWVLIILVYIAIFYDYDRTYYCVLYGIIFGFLVDLLYTDMLGVYMFAYGMITYIAHGLKKLLHANLYVTIILAIVSVALADTVLFVLYTLVDVTNMGWDPYWHIRLIPTIIANLVFALFLYPLFPGKLQQWSETQLERPKSV
ncbi:rod shape-determining protein MreD [Pontibacillus marinus]|uniref:Cell shape-determining protein n=1 Tax=Pontibacillus marinus BH030004 = DSM 16465 TaxID=1385511 RepID=A0A0A5HWQ7_9BACI|nr:rod shape-determining protein MreD [Pontibacillus marinus]KGX88042.1 cell shape-determining protein [Pontibacillus marinus BH030004 = DSM 16465]